VYGSDIFLHSTMVTHTATIKARDTHSFGSVTTLD
jgi:hypothetical protein